MGRPSKRSIKLDTAGRMCGLDLGPGRIRRQQAEQDEPRADNRARKPHYEEGFTGGKENPTKRDPPTRKEQGDSRTRNPEQRATVTKCLPHGEAQGTRWEKGARKLRACGLE